MLRSIVLLAAASTVFAQSPDTALTQTLITEIRALRQDLEAINVTSQRVQIALYRLQSQSALVAAAQQRLDAARSRANESERVRKDVTRNMRSTEDQGPRNATPEEKMNFDALLNGYRTQIEGLLADETQRRAAETDAESQLRAEQAKLVDHQSLLDRLDKVLDELARTKR